MAQEIIAYLVDGPNHGDIMAVAPCHKVVVCKAETVGPKSGRVVMVRGTYERVNVTLPLRNSSYVFVWAGWDE